MLETQLSQLLLLVFQLYICFDLVAEEVLILQAATAHIFKILIKGCESSLSVIEGFFLQCDIFVVVLFLFGRECIIGVLADIDLVLYKGLLLFVELLQKGIYHCRKSLYEFLLLQIIIMCVWIQVCICKHLFKKLAEFWIVLKKYTVLHAEVAYGFL